MWQVIKDFLLLIVKILIITVGGWFFLIDLLIPLYLCDLHPKHCEEILKHRGE